MCRAISASDQFARLSLVRLAVYTEFRYIRLEKSSGLPRHHHQRVSRRSAKSPRLTNLLVVAACCRGGDRNWVSSPAAKTNRTTRPALPPQDASVAATSAGLRRLSRYRRGNASRSSRRGRRRHAAPQDQPYNTTPLPVPCAPTPATGSGSSTAVRSHPLGTSLPTAAPLRPWWAAGEAWAPPKRQSPRCRPTGAVPAPPQ